MTRRARGRLKHRQHTRHNNHCDCGREKEPEQATCIHCDDKDLRAPKEIRQFRHGGINNKRKFGCKDRVYMRLKREGGGMTTQPKVDWVDRTDNWRPKEKFEAIGTREDLTDIIYNVSPEDTPFMSGIQERLTAWEKS